MDQALSRLARKGELMGVCQGVYVRTIKARFGPCPPAVEKTLASLSALWGETIEPCGVMAANALRLTTQTLIRSVYLTSGPNRKLSAGDIQELAAALTVMPSWMAEPVSAMVANG